MSNARTLDNPVTTEDRAKLKNIKSKLAKITDLIQRLENEGIVCDERRELCVTLSQMVEALERAFPTKQGKPSGDKQPQ